MYSTKDNTIKADEAMRQKRRLKLSRDIIVTVYHVSDCVGFL